MSTVMGRVAIAAAVFVLAYVASVLAAVWLFGSGNALVWYIAMASGIGTYVVLGWRARH
ncbi:MAG TPA: hypothetical protein VHR55_05590 [Candidatus Limnocylindria bacterium]|nr:hypothetical protein [Candidatus Limnocylindria bacterium]